MCVYIGNAEEEDIAVKRWNDYKQQYGKNYSLVEDVMRSNLFFSTLRRTVDHNAKTPLTKGFRRGINHLADWTREEYIELSGSRVNESPNWRILDSCEGRLCGRQTPDSLDWRNNWGIVGPVKDQKRCGSGWAFATTGLLEGQEHTNSTGGVVPLSEQNIIDCNGQGLGCHRGGIMDGLVFVMMEGGIETEASYPYKSGDGKDDFECSFESQKAFITTMHIKEPVGIKAGDEKLLKEMVAAYGPVAVVIDASLDSFREYKSGVYFDPECTQQVNHAMLVVGYGTSESGEDYWIVKNSWGEDWGMSGYVLMARNKDNHCGIASLGTVVFLEQP